MPKNGDVVANFLAMCQYTGVAPDEVLETNWESETFSTGHYVVYDRKLDAIVVSIRGTWSIIDSVADLLAKGVPFAFRGVSGYAHEGVLRCAEKKYAALLPLFNDLDGTRRLIFTGHSLGGGVAILLAMMVAERHPELRVSCTAFAPAPSLTLPLATHPRCASSSLRSRFRTTPSRASPSGAWRAQRPSSRTSSSRAAPRRSASCSALRAGTSSAPTQSPSSASAPRWTS